ncbi:MAG: hypothetical protein HWD59_04440 [Coxiellaceae bacterium]|nr:MAG: hypothetical protein HWD59_04440 [Coxiellaceae bacterium]
MPTIRQFNHGWEISSMPLAAREVTVIRQRIQNNKQHTLWMVPVRFDGTTEQCLPALLDKVNVIDATSAWPNYTAILHLMQRLLPHQQNLFGDIVSKWRQAQEVQSWQKNADRADELRRYVYAFYTYKKQQNEQRDEFIRRQLKSF